MRRRAMMKALAMLAVLLGIPATVLAQGAMAGSVQYAPAATPPAYSGRTFERRSARLTWQVTPRLDAQAPSEHKQVFVLYSTRRDAEFSIIGQNELPRMLDIGLGRNLDYYSEFVDLSRFPDATYTEAFREFLQQKYRGTRFDLVIALQDAAIEFVRDHRAALFGDTPAVYLANNPAIGPPSHSTGLIHERKFSPTVTLVRQLQPDARQVFIVTGAAKADKAFERAVRQQMPSDAGLTFTYLSGLETPDLETRLSTLPPHSVVYYVLVSEDGDGHKFHPLEYVDRVSAAANAPTYCWVDSAIGHGVVGGSLYSQRAAIQHVGQLALRVLRGESTDHIPVTTLDLNQTLVDWRQLRRWGIDEARVPQGTVVQFRDLTIWDGYKRYILTALALVILQTALIATLLIQRARRRRAEAEVLEKQGELQRSYERGRDLGARLLRAQETERSRIARELHDDICQRMLLLTIELESLGRKKRGDEDRVGEALILAREISRSLHELSHELHPARLKMIGLAAALEHLCVELSRTGTAIAYTSDNVPPALPPELMLGLFRVVQEALQNAIKYSHAKNVSVHLTCRSEQLVLTIIDTGVGFDVNAAWGRGVGLASMRERLEDLGGSLDIQSRPGHGTRLTATVPHEIVQDARAFPLTAPRA